MVIGNHLSQWLFQASQNLTPRAGKGVQSYWRASPGNSGCAALPPPPPPTHTHTWVCAHPGRNTESSCRQRHCSGNCTDASRAAFMEAHFLKELDRRGEEGSGDWAKNCPHPLTPHHPSVLQTMAILTPVPCSFRPRSQSCTRIAPCGFQLSVWWFA